MEERKMKFLRQLERGYISSDECARKLNEIDGPNGWTLHKLRKIVNNPNPADGFEVHLAHCWETNNAKSIFFLTGLDVSHLFDELNTEI